MYNNVLDIPAAINPEQVKLGATGKTYWVYNVSKGMSNYSQLKSKYAFMNGDFKTNGYSFCNTHMMGMGLIYTGIYNRFKSEVDKIYPEMTRLPDKIAKYLYEDPDMKNYYKKRFPALYKEYEAGKKDAFGPNELHNILSWGTNKLFDSPVTYFSTHTSWEDIIGDLIYYNTPVGISGKFSGLNHIVLLVGVAYSTLADGNEPGKCQRPDYLIVDDPFGKTYEYNKGLSGNDVWIPFDKCVEDFKGLNDPYFKYTHRFIRPEFLGID